METSPTEKTMNHGALLVLPLVAPPRTMLYTMSPWHVQQENKELPYRIVWLSTMCLGLSQVQAHGNGDSNSDRPANRIWSGMAEVLA